MINLLIKNHKSFTHENHDVCAVAIVLKVEVKTSFCSGILVLRENWCPFRNASSTDQAATEFIKAVMEDKQQLTLFLSSFSNQYVSQ